MSTSRDPDENDIYNQSSYSGNNQVKEGGKTINLVILCICSSSNL